MSTSPSDPDLPTVLSDAFAHGDLEAGRTLAEFLERRGEYDAAQQTLRAGVEKGDAVAARQLAEFHQRRGAADQADYEFRRAFDLGDTSLAETVARTLVRKNNLAEAEWIIRHVYDGESGDASLALLLAEVLELQGNLQGAVRILSSLKGVSAHRIARLFEKQGDLASAAEILRHAFERGELDAVDQLADIYIRQGELTRAADILQQAFEQGNLQVGATWAAVLGRQGNTERAISVLQELVHRGEFSAAIPFIDIIERSSDSSEQRDQLLTWLRSVLESSFRAGDKSAGIALAGILRRDGDSDRAIRIERAVNADDDEAHEMDMDAEEEDSRDRLVIAAVTSDLDDNVDQLGIDHDARALASLISSRQLQPPLAIGLYGEWGSGKTFFMKRIQTSIDLLQNDDQERRQFHSNIEHVWFNAWHYARGDIWASLLEHIFTHLSPSQSKPESIVLEALAHVRGVQQVVDQASSAVEVAQERVDELKCAVNIAEENHQLAVARVGTVAITDIWSGIGAEAVSDATLREELKSAAHSLGAGSTFDSAQELASAASEILSLGSKTITIATVGGFRSPLAWTIYAALAIGGLGFGAVTVFDELQGPVSAVLLQLGAVGGAIATWVKRQTTIGRRIIEPAWQLKKNVDNRLAEQRRKLDAELETVKQESAASAMVLLAAKEQEEEARAKLTAAQRAKNDLTGEQLLKSYLAERAGSGEYDHYLGVVGLAYRDLKDLSAFLEHAAKDEKEDTTALYRIVLYIDDLDRCDPETVVNVLDAVHLLLALPLFSVVVGVDPRWLASSLRARHSELLGGNVATTAADYLEKIFHLTYTLPPMNSQGSAALLRSSVNFVERKVGIFPYDPFVSFSSDSSISVTDSVAATEDARVFIQADSGGSGIDFSAGVVNSMVEGLTLTDADLEVLDGIAPLVATSPRRAKRFMSTYLVIRARVLSDSYCRSQFNRGEDGPDSLALLVGLFLGLPKTMQEAIKHEPSESDTVEDWAQCLVPASSERVRLEAFIATMGLMRHVRMVDVFRWEPIVAPYSGLQFVLDSMGERETGVAKGLGSSWMEHI
ncbi:hypothetical protein FEZ60_04680 [Rhodococcus sp. MS16]|uniref:P-loop NTPase fold protein n=1 Tax=Rhodococcus sp. MS16 TaxID=2579941 RepID=UPI001562D8D4|nr:P-loop NTPase fold protein [Rhodococcus sp. MS16]NRI64837.1 hypothetical protein [Rhodococcus sp. MS16]